MVNLVTIAVACASVCSSMRPRRQTPPPPVFSHAAADFGIKRPDVGAAENAAAAA